VLSQREGATGQRKELKITNRVKEEIDNSQRIPKTFLATEGL